MKVTIEVATADDLNTVKLAFPPHELLIIDESRGSSFGLSGNEVVGFLFVTLGGGIVTNAAYDILKSYFFQALARFKGGGLDARRGPKVTVNGITVELLSDADVDYVLDLLVDALEQSRPSQDDPQS